MTERLQLDILTPSVAAAVLLRKVDLQSQNDCINHDCDADHLEGPVRVRTVRLSADELCSIYGRDRWPARAVPEMLAQLMEFTWTDTSTGTSTSTNTTTNTSTTANAEAETNTNSSATNNKQYQ